MVVAVAGTASAHQPAMRGPVRWCRCKVPCEENASHLNDAPRVAHPVSHRRQIIGIMKRKQKSRPKHDLMLILGCLGRDGQPSAIPLFAAIPLSPHLLRRAAALTRVCEGHELDSVTTSKIALQPHWEFSNEEDRPQDLTCTWTAIGALQYFTLFGRSSLEEQSAEMAQTVLFDVTEWPLLARTGWRWDIRAHDDDPNEDIGLHRRICSRASQLFGPAEEAARTA